MNTKLVSSIDAVTRSRLVMIGGDALLVDAAELLSDTHISLVVVCNCTGAMVGVIAGYRQADRSVRGKRLHDGRRGRDDLRCRLLSGSKPLIAHSSGAR